MKKSLSLFSRVALPLVLLTSAPAFAKKVYGTFRVVKKDVKVISFKKKKTIKARSGMKVYVKDTIIAGKNSRAKIIMVDKNVINISPETKVNFENYVFEPKKNKKTALLNVLYGKIRSKVNQKYDGKKNKFQIKTPSAVAGVRGTDFFVNYNSKVKKTEVVTFEGSVKFGLPGANGTIKNGVKVEVGQIASNTSGVKPRPPKAVPPTQLAKFDKSSDTDKSSDADRRDPATNENKGKKDKPKKKKGETPKKNSDAAPKEDTPKEGKGPKKQAAGPDNEGKSEGQGNNNQAGAKEPGSKGPKNQQGASNGPGTPNPTAAAPTPSAEGGSATGGPAAGPAGFNQDGGDRRPASVPQFSPDGAGEPLLLPEDVVSFEPQNDIGVFDEAFDPANNIDIVSPTNVLDQASDVLQNCQTCRDVVTQGRTKLNIVIDAQ